MTSLQALGDHSQKSIVQSDSGVESPPLRPSEKSKRRLRSSAPESQVTPPTKRRQSSTSTRPPTRRSNRIAGKVPDPVQALEDSPPPRSRARQHQQPQSTRRQRTSNAAKHRAPSSPALQVDANETPSSYVPAVSEPVGADPDDSLHAPTNSPLPDLATTSADANPQALHLTFDMLMTAKLHREHAGGKAKWSPMSSEEKASMIEQLQKEELMARFSLVYDIALGQLSKDQRRARLRRRIDEMWQEVGLLGGHIRISRFVLLVATDARANEWC